MDWLIDKLLNYKFENYNELVKPNYRSISDPLFSWWIPVATGVQLHEGVQERNNMISIEKTDFDTRIYRYEPSSYDKKGCYLVHHNYLTLNVYLCIGGEYLIRLEDIKNVIDAFTELNRIVKRCYVYYEEGQDVIHKYAVEFLQLYGEEDVRMLQKVDEYGGRQNIETIKQHLKNCKLPSEDDLRRSGDLDYTATWFNKNHGRISERILGDNLDILPFDDVIDIGTSKYFIQRNRVHCLFFHMTNDDKVLQNVSGSIDDSDSIKVSTPSLKRVASSPITSGKPKASKALPTAVDT